MPGEDLKAEASARSRELRGEMIALSRALFDHPELSGQEIASVATIRAVLERHRFEVEEGLGGLPTAFRARRPGGGGGGPRLAMLAEYDALPEIGHGCGHNLIAAAGVFAGIVAADVLEGGAEITILGTPAEETIGGKVVLARHGIFDDFDAAMLVHPAAEDRAYSTSLACMGIEVEFTGKAAHAVAHPEKGINALDPLLQLFHAIDAARRGWSPDVRTPGIIREGGVRANIVPERAVGQFTLRAARVGTVRQVRLDIERMVAGIAAGSRTRATVVSTDHPYFEMVTNRPLAEAYRANLVALGRVPQDGPRRNQGSLDMGNVSYRCPAIHPFVAICPPEMASHTREFGAASVSAAGEKALLDSVQALAMTACDLALRPELVAAARQEFERFRASPHAAEVADLERVE